MQDEFEKLVNRLTEVLVRKLRRNGLIDPEDKVNDIWLALGKDLSWMNGKVKEQWEAYIYQRAAWKISDGLRSPNPKSRELPLDFRADKVVMARMESFTKQIEDIGFRRMLERILSYKGPAPTPSKATDWYLPKRHGAMLSDCIKMLKGSNHTQALKVANEIFVTDLERVVNNIIPSKGRIKLEMQLGLEPASEKPKIRPYIEAAVKNIMTDFQFWAEHPEELTYESFFGPYQTILQESVGPYIENLGITHEERDSALSHREKALILLRLRPYFENLEGKDLAKGKALLLNKFIGLTIKDVANDMFLSYDQVRNLIEKSINEIRSLKDKI